MRTILMVDDESAARYGMGRALEKTVQGNRGGVGCGGARGGGRLRAPDLILLDLVMPGEDGISFLAVVARKRA